jgi:hypothetical protein
LEGDKTFEAELKRMEVKVIKGRKRKYRVSVVCLTTDSREEDPQIIDK